MASDFETVASAATSSSGTMTRLPLNRLQEFGRLTASERDLVGRLTGRPLRVQRLQVIQQQGVTQECLFILIDGWVTSSIVLPDGRQQIAKVHLPGDLLGCPSLALRKTAESLVAVTPAMVAKLPLKAVATVFEEAPRLGFKLFLSAQRERIALMDALTALGQLPAHASLAKFVLDIYERTGAAGVREGSSFDLPLSQPQIADILGLSNVHVSRSVNRLRQLGLVAWEKQRVSILDLSGLRELGITSERTLHDPDWLFDPASSAPT